MCAQPQEGYLKLYRRIFSSSRWYDGTEFDERSAWIDILGRVAFMPTTINIKGVDIHLNVGDFIASQRGLAQAWNWSRGRVRNFISKEMRNGKLRAKFKSNVQAQLQAQGINVLNVCNFERYNYAVNNASPRPSPRPAHPSYINKEVREEKEELSPYDSPSTPIADAWLTPEFYDDEEEVEEVAMQCASHQRMGVVAPTSQRMKNVVESPRAIQSKNFIEENESVATCQNTPSLNEWRDAAFAVGWRHIREIDSSWGNYSAGGWKQKNGLPIKDWRAQLVVSRNWWDMKNGRIADESLELYIDPQLPIRGWIQAYLELTRQTADSADGVEWKDVCANKPLALRLLRYLWDNPETRKNFV